MTNREGDALLQGLEQIAGLAIARETHQAMIDAIVELAKKLVPTADGVGLTLRDDHTWTTTSHSDDFVVEIDLSQYRASVGPCVDSAADNRAYRSDDLSADERWPTFTQQAASVGVRSVLSVPLTVSGVVVGALNLYAFAPNAFTEDSEGIATVLARHAAIGIANRNAIGGAETMAEQLREALKTRELIGEAKGILMERHNLTSDEAFDELRRMSQSQNRKLRTIAEEIVSSAGRMESGS